MSDIIAVGPTDTPVAERVLAWATQRALDRGHSLRLVAVLDGDADAASTAALVDEYLHAMRERIEQEAERLRASGIEVDTDIRRGNPTEELIGAAADAALLVIGSDSRGPGSSEARGVHGVRITAAAPCPVVVVPDVDVGARSGVVVGVDGSATSEKALAWAAAEADRLSEPLIAVSAWVSVPPPRHMRTLPKEYLTNMQSSTEESLDHALRGVRDKYPDLDIVTRVERGHPAAVVNVAAAEAKLVVVGTHGRGAFRRLLLGSVSHEVLSRLATVTAVVR